MATTHQKKMHLGVFGRRTKWAPIWVVVKKFGAGKRIHPSAVTHQRRNWRTKKLKLKPRRNHRRHSG